MLLLEFSTMQLYFHVLLLVQEFMVMNVRLSDVTRLLRHTSHSLSSSSNKPFDERLARKCFESSVKFLSQLPQDCAVVLPQLISKYRSVKNRLDDPEWLDVKSLRRSALQCVRDFGEGYARSAINAMRVVHGSCAKGIDSDMRRGLVEVLVDGFARCCHPAGRAKAIANESCPLKLEEYLNEHSDEVSRNFASLAYGLSKTNLRKKKAARLCGLSAVPEAVSQYLVANAKNENLCSSRLLATLQVLFQRKHLYHPKIASTCVKVIFDRFDELTPREAFRLFHCISSSGLPISNEQSLLLYDKLCHVGVEQKCDAALFFVRSGHITLAKRILPADDVRISDAQALRSVAETVLSLLVYEQENVIARPTLLRKWNLLVGRLCAFLNDVRKCGVVDEQLYLSTIQKFDVPDALLGGTAAVMRALNISTPPDEWTASAREQVRQSRENSLALPGRHWSKRVYRACGLATFDENACPSTTEVIWSGELEEKDCEKTSLIPARVGKVWQKFTRSGDTEFQALSKAMGLFDSKVSGTVRIYVDKVPCLSCIGVFAQFLHQRPNIKLQVSYDDWHELYTPALQPGDPYTRPSNTSFDV